MPEPAGVGHRDEGVFPHPGKAGQATMELSRAS
jgi:hypothetical protein